MSERAYQCQLTPCAKPLHPSAPRAPPAQARAGRPVSPATLWRWSSHGLRGVRLETVRVGGTTCTSTEALSRFFAALSGESPPETAPVPTGAADRAAAALDAIGI